MRFLSAIVLPVLALVAPSLGGMLEARQAFPVNGTCRGEPTDTFGPKAFDLLVEWLYIRKNVTYTFSNFFSTGCTCPSLFPPTCPPLPPSRASVPVLLTSPLTPDTDQQHDPFISGGANKNLRDFAKQWAAANITLVHKGQIGANVSLVHYVYEARGQPAEQVVDLFQMQGVCVTEHWGVIQNVTKGSDVKTSGNVVNATYPSDVAGAS